MATRTVEAVRISTAAPEVLWELLADVTTWSEWGLFEESRLEAPGDPEPNGVGARRALRADRLRTIDEVFVFEPPRRLGYIQVDGNIPARNYRSEVTLTPTGAGTEIRWRSSFEPKVFGTGWMIDRNLKLLLADAARRLAIRAETGAPAADD